MALSDGEAIEEFETVMAAVHERGVALQFASKHWQRDFDVVMTAVKQDGLALEFAHESMKSNFDIVMAAAQQDGHALQFAHESMKSNREIALAAIEQDYSALQFAHEGWRALGYAGEGARRDFDIVMAAVEQSGYALQFAHWDTQVRVFSHFKEILEKKLRRLEQAKHIKPHPEVPGLVKEMNEIKEKMEVMRGLMERFQPQREGSDDSSEGLP